MVRANIAASAHAPWIGKLQACGYDLPAAGASHIVIGMEAPCDWADVGSEPIHQGKRLSIGLILVSSSIGP
jgi:hypothetical protein